MSTSVQPASPSSPPPHCTHEADISLLNTAIVEIKDTLKDLKELLLSNAVLSEQVAQFKESITGIDIRLRKLELDVAQGKGNTHWMERILWLIITIILSGMIVISKP